MLDGFAALRAWSGDGRLDLLVSNAGIADPVSGPIEDLSLADWRRWQDSHVTGAFLAARGAVPLLRRTGGGIVVISSTRALQSEPQTEAYAAAKGALTAMTHALAVSLGPQIRVNCIRPAASDAPRMWRLWSPGLPRRRRASSPDSVSWSMAG